MKALNTIKRIIGFKLIKNVNFSSLKKTINTNMLIKTNNYNFCVLNKNNEQKFSESEAMELIEAGVFEVLKTAAKCKHDKLSRAASFKDLGFDSLDQVELVVAMEEKFNINISGKKNL